MTLKETDHGEYCPTCKHQTKRSYDYEQICDWCGKQEKFMNSNCKPNVIEIDVFPIIYSYEGVVENTFCSFECMIQWIANHDKPYSFMTLPYIKGSVKEDSGNQRNYISQEFLKTLINGQIKWPLKAEVK